MYKQQPRVVRICILDRRYADASSPDGGVCVLPCMGMAVADSVCGGAQVIRTDPGGGGGRRRRGGEGGEEKEGRRRRGGEGGEEKEGRRRRREGGEEKEAEGARPVCRTAACRNEMRVNGRSTGQPGQREDLRDLREDEMRRRARYRAGASPYREAHPILSIPV